MMISEDYILNIHYAIESRCEPIFEDEVYFIFSEIDKRYFERELLTIHLYWISQELRQYIHADTIGLYAHGALFLDKDFYKDHGADDEFIKLVYHELLHAYCDRHGIKDVIDAGTHTREYMEASLQHGGQWSDDFREVDLLPGEHNAIRKALNDFMEYLKQRQELIL